MDYRSLTPVEITNIIECTESAKLCGSGFSKDNILFHVTSGTQFTKLMAKCGKQILDKPNSNGDYYIIEVIRSKLLPAIEAGDEQLISMYSTFFEIFVNDYGHIPLLRVTSDKKETAMHILFHNKVKHTKLEDLYKLAVAKIPKRLAKSMVDLNGINILGDFVEPYTPRRSDLPQDLTIDIPGFTPSTTPTPLVSAGVTPRVTPQETPKNKLSIQTEQDNEINPFTGKQTPSACITVLKGYETHFFNHNFVSYLKTIKK